ncbi:putative serine/threonine-protein kinase [Hordeum vulgare]|nr:putative serine/threonine-protein kinase [Hordeum vulgare]
MDDDFDVFVGLAPSSGITIAPSLKGKPRTLRKTVTVSKKKELTPEELARESAKRKGRMANARDEAMTVAAIAVVTQQEDNAARVAAATREALLYLGLNPSRHGLVKAVVVVASIGSYAFPWMVLPESPRASTTHPIPRFHVYPQASCLSGAFRGNVCRR